MDITNQISGFLKLIENSKKILILTGAGISTESGLPDFRSDDGFWTKNKPIMFNEFLNDKNSRRLSWERNIELKKKLSLIEPNVTHYFVKKLIDKSNLSWIHHNHSTDPSAASTYVLVFYRVFRFKRKCYFWYEKYI